MTFTEKSTILAALCDYEKAERKKAAEYQRKRGEHGKAKEHERSASIAASLKFAWAEILGEPAGSVKI